MHALHRYTSVVSGNAARRMAAVLAASTATLLLTLGVGVGASSAAGAFGPHNADAQHQVTSSTLAPHVVAPLTLANIVVTNLSDDTSTLYSSSTITPDYAPSSAAGCNQSPTSPLCLRFGDPSTSGYTFYLQVPSPGLTGGGNIYVNPAMSVVVPGGQCGSLFDSSVQGTITSAAEVDQYNLTTTPQATLNAVAVQFDCTNDSQDISGTIAYNIVPTDPSSGYYVFGQEGELSGFGNDNYLVYLNGALYYNLNAPSWA
jgi:hypothetical protein